MKIFGYNRAGFLYINTGKTLISQQTTSDESNMINKYVSLPEFKDFDEAKYYYFNVSNDAYELALWKEEKKLRLQRLEDTLNTGIDRNFQEDMIDDMDMGQ
tara:strand:+ start:22812 stop:23114 length:303 start_codon:yes stop_codon:yes gene_type:complete